jgi:adenylate cyclase
MRWVADPSTARRDIVLVRIDETSIAKMEPLFGRWPWPRVAHASAIDFLARGPAKAVVYDVLFTERDRTRFRLGDAEWTGEESDRAFAESIARAGNVVLVADATKDEDAAPEPLKPGATPDLAGDSYGEERWSLLRPIPELTKAARAIGHNFFVLDADGPVRRHVPFVPFVSIRGETIPSLGVAAYALVTGRRRDDIARQIPIVEETILSSSPRVYDAPTLS